MRGLADVDGEVSDALQVGADPERRHDGSQIDRDRLVQRDEREASIVDFDLEIVDARIAGNDVGERLCGLDRRAPAWPPAGVLRPIRPSPAGAV